MFFSVRIIGDCHTEARNFTLQKVPYFPFISIQESLWSRAIAATGSSLPPIWPLEGHFMVDGLCSRNHCRCNCKLIKNHICCTTKTTKMYIATRRRHDFQCIGARAPQWMHWYRMPRHFHNDDEATVGGMPTQSHLCRQQRYLPDEDEGFLMFCSW